MENLLEHYEKKEDGYYLKPFLNYPERKISELSENLDELIENFQKVKSEVDNLINKINQNTNKGSFLVHLQSLKEQLTSLKGIGDFKSLLIEISDIEHSIILQIEQNREKNLAIKTALILELKEVINSESEIDTLSKIQIIKQKWIKTGAVNDELKEKIESEYQSLIDVFFEKRNKIKEEKHNKISESIVLYNQLIEKMEVLIKEVNEGSKKSIIELQNEWNAIEKIPQKVYIPLFKKFSELSNDFFNRYNKKASNQNLIERKKIVDLLNEMDINKVQINNPSFLEIQQNWKKIGRTQGNESDKLFNEFYFLTDKIYERSKLNSLFNKLKNKLSESDANHFFVNKLQDLIKRQKSDIKVVEENIGAFRITTKNKQVETSFYKRVDSAERKLTVYQSLLKEYKNE